MIKRVITIALLTTVVSGSLTAQTRDYRKERAELARQEREEKRRRREEQPVNYGANILSVAPMTAMDIGIGFGLSYERIFGKEGMVGLVLPVSFIMEDRGSGYFTGDIDVSSNHSYVYFTPGLKIYPFGQRRVTYAVGPSLMLGYGGGKEWRWYYDGGIAPGVQVETDITKLRLGMLVNNYVNFQISRSFNLGLNAGFGIRYIDRQTERNVLTGTREYNYRMTPTGQASITLGFRFK